MINTKTLAVGFLTAGLLLCSQSWAVAQECCGNSQVGNSMVSNDVMIDDYQPVMNYYPSETYDTPMYSNAVTTFSNDAPTYSYDTPTYSYDTPMCASSNFANRRASSRRAQRVARRNSACCCVN